MWESVIRVIESLSWGETLALSLGLFLVSFVGSIVLVSVALVRLPTTYFQGDRPPPFWQHRHPALRWLAVIGKNLVGVVLVLFGIIMALPGVPGQGFLTILIGIMFLDFPGKRRLERKIVSRPMVLRAVNRLRARWGKPAFVLDQSSNPSPVGEEGLG
jgi:hypothetical protein